MCNDFVPRLLDYETKWSTGADGLLDWIIAKLDQFRLKVSIQIFFIFEIICMYYRAQAHTVKLPDNFTCDDCTIRLLRQVKLIFNKFISISKSETITKIQASEWANQYRFWSCSDVDIVPAKKFKETCSGNGRAVVGRCVCNKGTNM